MNTSAFFKVLMIHLSLHDEKLTRTLQGESRERAVIFRRKFSNVYFFRKHVVNVNSGLHESCLSCCSNPFPRSRSAFIPSVNTGTGAIGLSYLRAQL